MSTHIIDEIYIECHVPLNRVELTSLVPPVTVGAAAEPVSVADTEDGIEELPASETAVPSAEDVKDAEAASSVADEGAVVTGASPISSCRGSGRATPAKTMLKHRKKQRTTPHILGG